MKKIYNVRSGEKPSEIAIENNNVIIASNIHEYHDQIDEYSLNGYEYDCEIYGKDEYLIHVANQTKIIEELQDELAATKILLGVE